MFLIKLLSRLPLEVLYALAPVLYIILYYLVGLRKRTVIENLHNSFPDKTPAEIKRIAKRFYRNYADVVVEMIKSISMDSRELDKRVTIRNQTLLEDYFERGQSVIVMLAHQCNLEWLMMAASIKLAHPLDAVYKPLSNQSLDRLLLASRSRFGGDPIRAKHTLMEIIKRKNQVRGYAIAPDQSPRGSDEKYWTRFLNQDTAFFLGVEKIARLTKCPVVFIGSKRIKRGYYEAEFKALAEPPYQNPSNEITEHYAREVERQILKDPPDWLWSHRRWKHKKPVYS